MSNAMKIIIGMAVGYIGYGEYADYRRMNRIKNLQVENLKLKNSNEEFVRIALVNVATISYLTETLNKHGIPMDKFDKMAMNDIQTKF